MALARWAPSRVCRTPLDGSFDGRRIGAVAASEHYVIAAATDVDRVLTATPQLPPRLVVWEIATALPVAVLKPRGAFQPTHAPCALRWRSLTAHALPRLASGERAADDHAVRAIALHPTQPWVVLAASEALWFRQAAFVGILDWHDRASRPTPVHNKKVRSPQRYSPPPLSS